MKHIGIASIFFVAIAMAACNKEEPKQEVTQPAPVSAAQPAKQ